MMRRRSRATEALCLLRARRKSKMPMSTSEHASEETLLRRVEEAHRALLAEQSRDGVFIRLAGAGLVVEDHRHAGVRSAEYAFGFRNHAEHFQPEDLLDVIDAHHFAVGHAYGVVAREQQMRLHRRGAEFGA